MVCELFYSICRRNRNVRRLGSRELIKGAAGLPNDDRNAPPPGLTPRPTAKPFARAREEIFQRGTLDALPGVTAVSLPSRK
jgi:hypothetical protein